MTDKKEQNREAGKGFAGLSSLVSNVDTEASPAVEKEPPVSVQNDSHPTQPQQSQGKKYQDPAFSPPTGLPTGKWVLGIAAAIGILWFIVQSDNKEPPPRLDFSRVNLAGFEPDTSKKSTIPSHSSIQNTADKTWPKDDPLADLLSTQSQAPARPTESKPPVGKDLLLSTEQIRYCLAEDIRMDGAKAALNNYIDSDVRRFNAMVADYNSRCARFRYRKGALERARKDVTPYRDQLLQEGRHKIL